MIIDTLFSSILNKREKERAINARPFDRLIILCKFYRENLTLAFRSRREPCPQALR